MQARNTELTLHKQLGLDTFGVAYHAEESVMSLITKDVLKAGKLVVNQIRKEITNGLPVREVTLRQDSGQNLHFKLRFH